MNKMDNETREEANKKYAEWQAVVRSKGYISELSKLLPTRAVKPPISNRGDIRRSLREQAKINLVLCRL